MSEAGAETGGGTPRNEVIIEGEATVVEVGETSDALPVTTETALVPINSANVEAVGLSIDATHDLNGLIRWGKLLHASGMFNDVKGAAQAIVKVLAGRSQGMTAIESMTGINVISGRVSYSANTIAAFIKRSGKYNFRVRELTNERCVLVFLENGEEVGPSEFTLQDATTAGLTRNPTWRAYPRNMLFARALTNGARWYCADLFIGGCYTHDELPREDN